MGEESSGSTLIGSQHVFSLACSCSLQRFHCQPIVLLPDENAVRGIGMVCTSHMSDASGSAQLRPGNA